MSIAAVWSGASGVVRYAPAPVQEGVSPEDIVQRFCQADASGKRLTQESASEVQPFLAEQNAWIAPLEITIIKDYRVRQFPYAQRDAAQVTVDYNVWGELDSSLSFTAIGGPFQSHPTPIPEFFEMTRLNSQPERLADGSSESAQWKISKAPLEPHISVEAAIRHVRETGYASKNALVRARAQRTLAELQRTAQLQLWSRAELSSSPQSPTAVLSQFLALETEGRGLALDGMKQLETLFVRPPAWQQGRIHVAKSYSIEDTPFLGKRGDIYVDYVSLGELDSSMRFTATTSPNSKVREAYTLVLQSGYATPNGGHQSIPQQIVPGIWKIENGSLEEWIRVSTAMRYVTTTRDGSSDPVVKMNANATLTVLAPSGSSGAPSGTIREH